MKTQTPFWKLLRNGLALGWFGGTPQLLLTVLVYWLCLSLLPLAPLFSKNGAGGNIVSLFESGLIPVIAFPFLAVMTVWITYATIPAFSDMLSPSGLAPGPTQKALLEFLFTRAINRRTLFRARALICFTLLLAPLLFNVAISPIAPDVKLASGDVKSMRYRQAFPAMNGVRATAAQFAIPHGTVAFTAWLAWSSTLAFLLLQGYGLLVAKRVKPDNWWTIAFPAAPIFILLLVLIVIAKSTRSAQLNIYESSFLFFSAHPLAMVLALAVFAVLIQTWCEQRFSRLEIL